MGLPKHFRVILRGEEVKRRNLVTELKHSQYIRYRRSGTEREDEVVCQIFFKLNFSIAYHVYRIKRRYAYASFLGEDITFILSVTQMENFQIISLMMDNHGFSFNVFNVGSTPKCGGRVSGRHTRVR
jgi:hypothetical protein